MSRILILTASFGEGHNAATRNLRESIYALEPSAQVEVSDIFLETYGWLNKSMQKAYLLVINRAPAIWSIIFALLERPGLLEGHMWIYRRAANRLAAMLRENPPDIVVSAYPGCNHLLDLIFRGRPRSFLTVTVITDSITINTAWLRAHSDCFVVANEPSAEVLRVAGAAEEKIKVLGFPVPRIFAALADRRENHSSDGRWNVLYVVNSAHHLAPAVVRELMKIETIRLTVTYGKDEALRDSLRRLVGDKDVTLYGWTSEMPQLMASNHLMISKAGGATVQEALAARTPMIVTQIVPGQEEGNARLLIEAGAGTFAATPEAISATVREVFGNGAEKWRAWYEAAMKLSRPDAADQIARFLLEEGKANSLCKRFVSQSGSSGISFYGGMIFADGSKGGPDPVKASARGWLIWGAAALFYLYEFFVRVAPSAMEPELQRSFHLTAAGLGAAMGVYYTIYAPMQLLAGSFLDRFGAKFVLVPAAIICTSGCLLEVFGHTTFLLSTARFLQGFGSAFAFVGTMYLAAEWFPRTMLALLSGLTTSLGMAGAIIGNAGIADAVGRLGWRHSLIVATGVGVLVTLMILIFVPRKSRRRQERAKDVELERGPSILRSLKIVYSNPQSWFAGIVGTSLYMPLSVLGALWGEEYVSAITGADKVGAAGAVSMLYVGWLIGGPIAGWFSDHKGVRRNMLLVAGVLTFITTIVFVCIPRIPLAGAYVLLLVLGLFSCSQVVCFVTAVEHNPARVAGTAIAATNMLIMLLGGMGEWLFGVILDHFSGGSMSSNYPEAAYRKAILLLPAISAIGVVAAFLLKESYRRAEIPPGPVPMV